MIGLFFYNEGVMENLGYGNLGNKLNRIAKDRQNNTILSLKDINANRFNIQNSRELKKIFSADLKKVLKNENIFNFITDFFELENELQIAIERLVLDEDLFNFDEFYKNFSPLLMRAILENSTNPEDSEQILKSIKESLRIALEGELYRLEDQYES
jgi:hypothetical protein